MSWSHKKVLPNQFKNIDFEFHIYQKNGKKIGSLIDLKINAKGKFQAMIMSLKKWILVDA